MIDIKRLISEDKDYIFGIIRKGIDEKVLRDLVKNYKTLNEISAKLDEKRALQNKLAKNLPNISGEEKEKSLKEMGEIKTFLKKNTEKEENLRKEFKKNISKIPNPAHKSVLDGKGEDDNKTIRFFGEKKVLDFKPKKHFELGETLDLIDSKRGAKVAGARFHFLKNELVFLEFALIQYALEIASKKGFSPMIPPFLVNEKTAFGTGYLDTGHDSEIYSVNKGLDDLYLIGTSEIPNTAYFSNEIIKEEDLPIKFVSYSPCFRREAGSGGKDMAGILRCHQFEKIELAVFCSPENSFEELEKLRELEEEIYQGLGIHYQLVDICIGDLGGHAVKKYDIEAWMPGEGKYREITSTSNCTDYQARRLNIRMKGKEGNEILHTLNGTAIAIGRTLIAIMEQFQTKEGEIEVPKALKKYLNFNIISKK